MWEEKLTMGQYTVKEISQDKSETVTMDNGDEYIRYSEYNWAKVRSDCIESEYGEEADLELAYQEYKKPVFEFKEAKITPEDTKEIFELNLQINGKEKLQKWLYGECLELAAALIAVELDPTENHFMEIYEEIADVLVLLNQYAIFHNIDYTHTSNNLSENFKEGNVSIADTLACSGLVLSGWFDMFYYKKIRTVLNFLIKEEYSSPEIEKIYYEKIKKLKTRLDEGEFS